MGNLRFCRYHIKKSNKFYHCLLAKSYSSKKVFCRLTKPDCSNKLKFYIVHFSFNVFFTVNSPSQFDQMNFTELPLQ